MLARLPPSARTLDLCCDTGQLEQGLARRGYQVTGIDGSEEGYRARWRGSFGIAEDDHVCVVRPSFEEGERVGKTAITMFRIEGEIRHRSDVTLVQRCYAAPEINSTLKAAGFVDIQTYDAQNDLAWSREVGRAFFLSQKPGKDGRG